MTLREQWAEYVELGAINCQRCRTSMRGEPWRLVRRDHGKLGRIWWPMHENCKMADAKAR